MVVVDDGGEGEAERVLSPFRQAAGIPVRVVEGPGRGPGAARNAGMAEATGELIAFLDDDDLWLPQKLEWQVEWFLRRLSVGVVGTLWTEGEGIEAGKGAAGRRPGRLRRVSRRALMKANRLATSGVVVRRESVERCGGFDESLALAQDWDLWLRMAQDWEVGIVPARLVVYRRHEGQRSTDRARMRRWEGEVVRRALEGGGLGGRWLEGVGRRRLAWAHGRLGRLLAREGEIKGAITELRESVNLFPYNPLVWTSLVRCALARRGWAGAKP
jgi:glycosyltransferase involved in cell wall biosynthesis